MSNLKIAAFVAVMAFAAPAGAAGGLEGVRFAAEASQTEAGTSARALIVKGAPRADEAASDSCSDPAALLRRVPARFRPHAMVVRLKNMVRPVPAPGGDGEMRYEPICLSVLTVHAHVALLWGPGMRYSDDAVDLEGRSLRLDQIDAPAGFKSLVSGRSLPTPVAPANLLSEAASGILKRTLEDVAVKCAAYPSEAAARAAGLDELSRRVDAACAGRFEP